MSLILEALRKSEAERQLGRPPGLLSPAPAVTPKRAMPAWVAAAVLVLLAVGLGSWWLGRQGAAPGTAAPSMAVPALPALPDSASPDRASAATGAAPGSPPTADPAAQPAASAETRPSVPITQAPQAATPPAPRPAADTPEPAPLKVPDPTRMEAYSKAPVPPQGGDDSADLRIPLARIEHMPAADRARLPALKLSVHLFAEQSDRRFAIIDGRRVTDDDNLAKDLAVKAIVPEGVLLEFEGRTWLLPRP